VHSIPYLLLDPGHDCGGGEAAEQLRELIDEED